ncbi:MAG: FAD-dependent oxidoreductase, partial [Candidatus Tectomicrobia bacterium]|nr:FAD-dependent oxidoreductase [Candidatus Tectomicrobia bacterium]
AKIYEDRIDNGALTSERNAYYHAERAKGGAGLIIMEYQMVHPTSTGGLFHLSQAWRSEIVPRYRMVAHMVHEHGGLIFSQLCHTGIHASGSQIDDYHASWAPSQIWGLSFDTPAAKEMELEDIKEVVNGFRISAKHAKEGGLDGVEIHAAHSYLLAQFLSPLTNKRKDEYGDSLENRLRIMLEVIDAIRKEVGDHYPVGIRISAEEFTPGGLNLDTMTEVAKRLEDAGQLDYISVSQGAYWTLEASNAMIPGMSYPPGSFLHNAAGIKKVIKKLPIVCVGRIKDPEHAEKILEDGLADMIGMCRALICDPELPNKAREGRLEDIRHCMACQQGCLARINAGLSLTCVQNPAAGREKRLGLGTLKPADRKKKVIVVGGGISGLKAAEIAARRGHNVYLYEKEKDLGGQIRLAAKTSTRKELEEIIRYLIVQVNKIKVNIRTGTEVTAEIILKESPEAVVVATGSAPVRDGMFYQKSYGHTLVKGLDQENVVTLWEVLGEKVQIGKRVAIVDGEANWRTLSVAEYLLDSGKEVEIITHYASPSQFITYLADRLFYARRISKKGAKIIPGTEVREITGNTIITFPSSQPNREGKIEGIDTIVWAAGVKSNDALYFDLKAKVKELYRVGDCVAPRAMEHAIWEGEEIGRAL